METVAYCPYCDSYQRVDEMTVGARDITFKLKCGHLTRLKYPTYGWVKK